MGSVSVRLLLLLLGCLCCCLAAAAAAAAAADAVGVGVGVGSRNLSSGVERPDQGDLTGLAYLRGYSGAVAVPGSVLGFVPSSLADTVAGLALCRAPWANGALGR